MGTHSSKRSLSQRQAAAVAGSITPSEIAKAKRVYESKKWTRPDGGIGVRSGWRFTLVPTAIIDDQRTTVRIRFKGGGAAGKRRKAEVSERMIGKCGRLVALALCRFVDGRGICWPSWTTIQAASGLNRDGVRRGIQELEEGGYLERDRGAWKPGNKGVVTVYCLRSASRRRRPK